MEVRLDMTSVERLAGLAGRAGAAARGPCVLLPQANPGAQAMSPARGIYLDAPPAGCYVIPASQHLSLYGSIPRIRGSFGAGRACVSSPPPAPAAAGAVCVKLEKSMPPGGAW